mmetsp:Transcript_49075/g.157895  ORF Transcript_49075/g.157895 Transcript_49075/m.157895 type:complete len:239 (+) Transcript_49075:490-1206(+)
MARLALVRAPELQQGAHGCERRAPRRLRGPALGRPLRGAVRGRLPEDQRLSVQAWRVERGALRSAAMRAATRRRALPRLPTRCGFALGYSPSHHMCGGLLLVRGPCVRARPLEYRTVHSQPLLRGACCRQRPRPYALHGHCRRRAVLVSLCHWLLQAGVFGLLARQLVGADVHLRAERNRRSLPERPRDRRGGGPVGLPGHGERPGMCLALPGRPPSYRQADLRIGGMDTAQVRVVCL